MRTIVLIDSSYYNFFRFTASLSWYNWSDDRVEDAEGVAWLDNPVFMKTFEKMWFETVKKITKKFGVETSDIIFARDGKDVWRYKVYPEYKATRKQADPDDPHSPGPVFKHVNAKYHKRVDGATVLRLEEAEADDIIAVAVWYIQALYPDYRIVVITGDHDLLQLKGVEIWQLRGWKCITSDDPYKSLLTKVVNGDSSDNIPPAWKGRGKKAALEDPEKLEEMLEKHGREQFDFNMNLINFEHMPSDVIAKIESLLDEVQLADGGT